jgi:hypothetical protein
MLVDSKKGNRMIADDWETDNDFPDLSGRRPARRLGGKGDFF